MAPLLLPEGPESCKLGIIKDASGNLCCIDGFTLLLSEAPGVPNIPAF